MARVGYGHTMQSQRWAWTHTYAVPLFVTSLVAVVLAGGALAGVLVFDRGGEPGGDRSGGPTPTPTPSPGSGPSSDPRPGPDGTVPECLIGTWEVVEQTQGMALVPNTLDLVGDGPVYELQPDGTGRVDYGDGVRFETISAGESVTVDVTGDLTFHYEVTEDSFRITETVSHAVAEITLIGEIPFDLDKDPVGYTCDGDTAAFNDPDRNYHASFVRAGSR